MRLFFSAVRGELEKAINDIQRPIAEAATAAVRDAAEQGKTEGRANIAAAGFSKKWQSALRADLYPKGRVSMRPAALLRHKIPYATVFEDGATITGKPLLWLPLPTVPVGVTAKNYRKKVGEPLFTIRRPGKPPLLAARVRLTDKRAAKGLSLSALRRGANIKIGKDGKVRRGLGTLRAVPLFVGVPAVKIGKKFNLRAIFARAAAQLGNFYVKNLKP